MTILRQPSGTPVGGQFATTPNAPADTAVRLGDDPVRDGLLAELGPWGDIPAPQPGQTLRTGEPAAATFAETYVEYFRPLLEGGGEVPDRPSDEEILDVAGLTGVDLGRLRGLSLLEKDGEAVIEVHTRNGGGNREHWQDETEAGPGCGCTGCIQSYAIPALPTYLSDEDDEGDSTYANIYFRAADADAGRALLASQRLAEDMAARAVDRRMIAKGPVGPWEILSPADHHEEAETRMLRGKAWQAGTDLREARRIFDHATAVMKAVDAGTDAPKPPFGHVARDAFSTSTYSVYSESARKHREEMADAEAQVKALRTERAMLLPVAATHIEALVEREIAGKRGEIASLANALARDETKLREQRAAAAKDLARRTELFEKATEAAGRARRALREAEWRRSWPGDPGDCPPAPEDAAES